MDDEEKKMWQEQMSLMGHLIGVCTDIKFELVNERLRRDQEREQQSGENVSVISRIAARIKRLFGWMS